MFLALFLQWNDTYACTITPSFSNSQSHTCGLPRIVSVTNTSTGSFSTSAKYWWKINSTKVTDTIIGKSSSTLYLKNPGSNAIKLFVMDSTGCIDSSSTSITVTTNAKSILDQNVVYSYQPTWMNCLQFITDPDTFRVNFESADTLKNLKIFWGDDSTDLSGNDLPPNSVKTHLYQKLGIFIIKIVTTNGSCTDTVYGTVYNQRQPTAGIIGPPSGSNRGCVPHTLRIVNNSYNISNNTDFLIDWGNGDRETQPWTTFNDTFYHTYSKGVCAGIIRITATNVCGSSFSTWNPIDISDKDKAKWAVTTTCSPSGNFVFQNLTTDQYCLLPDIKEYFWDFGDGSTVGWTGSKASQNHNYANEGDYQVKLIAKTACGNDTIVNAVQVYYNPLAGMTFDKDRGCLPLNVRLVDTSKGRGLSRLWTVNDGGTIKTFTDSILNYSFTKAGNNTVTLRVSNVCNSSTVSRTFVVTDKPNAGFANISSSCVPVTVNFTNTTTSHFINPTYHWDFGDSTYSTLKDPPQKIYTQAGTYLVRLIVSDSCGSDTFVRNFTAYDLPVAKLIGDTAACTFDSLDFYNLSINSNQFIWDFGDSQSLTTNDTSKIKHVYTVPGVYVVKLISGTASGCKDTASMNVLIKPGAKADFSFDKNFACSPATFKITNQSYYGKDFLWYANGQAFSTAFHPNDTLIQTDSTVINIKLVVTSNSSCQTDSLEKIFFTAKNPEANIAEKDSGCGPLILTLQNFSTNAYAYNWNLGNGLTSSQASPTTTYLPALNKDTFYKARLLVWNWASCKDSAEMDIQVYPGPEASFAMSDSANCGPLPIQFSNTSLTNNNDPFSTLTHQWDFGDGNKDTASNPSHTFMADANNDTIYNVSLKTTSINGCADSISLSVKVYPLPQVKFSADKYDGCAILDVVFSNESLPGDTGGIEMMTFEWQSGNGSNSNDVDFQSSYSGSNNGDTTYKVKLIGYSEHGCKDSAINDITVHPQPIANFTVNSNGICTPAIVITNNLSQSRDGNPLSHEWQFDNGYISNSENDSSIYFNNSDTNIQHTIVYQAISAFGCRDTSDLDITIYPKPKVDFSVSSLKICSPAIVTLNDQSLNAQNHYWSEGLNEFGDTNALQIVLPGLKLFDTTYVIAHSVRSSFGCQGDTVYRLIQVYGRPDAGFELAKDSACLRENINFLNTTFGAYQYNWQFGDNASSNAVNPKHKYKASSGNKPDTTFMVSLEAISPLGCRDTTSKPVTLVRQPSGSISFDQQIGCSDLKVTMSSASTDFTNMYWDPGDNSGFFTGDTLTHVYSNQSGNTTMQPIVKLYRYRHNCLDTAKGYVFVYPRPVAVMKIQRNDPCDGGTYQFINQTAFSSQVNWVVDTNPVSSSNSFTYNLAPSYYRDSQYAVQMMVDNIYGCSDTSEQIVKVKPKLLLNFERNPIVACEKANVNFTNKSFNAVRYLWKFGDGVISTDVHPTHAYNSFGNYEIKLFGYDKDGCVDSSAGQTMIKILERPVANFDYMPVFPKLPDAKVDFNATPTILSANVSDLTYDWDFGDGNYPENNFTQKSPSHTYSTSGTFLITLKVANQGCDNSITKSLFVEDPKPEIEFTADTLEGCVPFKVNFKNSTKFVVTYRWIFGDGSPDSYEKEPSHTFNIPGTWSVTLVATGTGGTSTLTKQYLITTYPKPTLDFQTTQRFLSLPNAVFNMRNNSNSVFNQWDVIDSVDNIIQSSTLREPSFIINTLGQYTVRLIGRNSYGCIDTLSKYNYIATQGQGFVYVPNSFSPNNNEKNERFMPSLVNVRDRNYTFRVYNRWGELLFETNDINAYWDGNFSGEACEQDVYIWTVNGEYYNGEQFGLRGTVTLLK